MEEKKYEYIKSLKLAGFLMQRGFRILRINHNLKIDGKDVYVFKQSEALKDCIFEYINTRTKEKYNNGNNNKRS